VISTFLISLLAYIGARRLSRPIETMADAVEQSLRGSAELVIPHESGAEIERLAAALRAMHVSANEKLAMLDDEKALLSSVIKGMREGLLLVDSNRYVRLANDSARDIFQLPVDPLGRPLTESIRHPTVIQSIEKALDDGKSPGEVVVQMPEPDRAFQLQVTPLIPRDGSAVTEVLALFHDISRLERLEGVRREFVANVSHELRTPLTSIKAFVETLLDAGSDDPENAKRFLAIIRKHADRMGELIEDLTDLSLIETGSVILDFQPVDVLKTVQGVVERLEPLAERRDVEVEVDIPPGLTLRADRRRLEQMLTNLVDNAVKFSHPGGEVRIHGTAGRDGTRVVVEDDGIGIPAESREKIFNRFYQVNRARSKELGGTGLGLAIVKHLMRLHDGRVGLESELGQGSRFVLEFPTGAGARVADASRETTRN
jgi:two-component system phosphate regulon sensor histidine kinase PhoR